MTEQQQLIAAAQAYYEIGFNVVTVKGKQPLQQWQNWISERQTQEEFNNLNFSDVDGYGVICGTKNKDDLYLAVVDFDVKKLPDKVIEKGRKVLKELPITQMEQTPSKGQHWIYYVHNKPKSVSVFHNEAALELIGENKLCIMAPSQGYKRLNDNSPTVVNDLEDLFYNALYAVGIKLEKQSETWFDRKEIAEKPYRGKDPNCIRELEKGTREGLRNEYGIRIASYYGNCKRYKPAVCLKILRTWNKLNEPSLDRLELEALLKSAYQGKYVYGCSDPILKSVCIQEGCVLAKKEIRGVTDQEKAKAEKLLLDPKLLDYQLALGRKNLIGEDDILQQNFVILVSGQTRYPISEVLTGHSGAGKNQSIRAVKPLIPEEWIFEFTTSTPEAVKYIPEDFTGTLAIYELAGIRSETGALGLRSIGEGEGIKTIYPMRDEATGEMKLGEKQTNARNFISTDSGLDIQADLYRRVFKNSMNDSKALTKRVCAKKLRDSSLPESLRLKLYPEKNKLPYSENDFRNALTLLDLNLEVVIFPPTTLLELIELANKREQEVALRTQIERILNFIKILALIHQKQRITLKDNENSYIIADAKDVEIAFTILSTSINETVTRIEKRQKEALEVFEKYLGQQINKNQLAEKLSCSTVTAARILKTLYRNGYLKEIQTTKPYSYEQSDEEKSSKPFVLSEKISEYNTIYPKELRKFLNSTLSPYHTDIHQFFSVNIPKDIEKKYYITTRQGDKELIKAEAQSVLGTEDKPLVFSERISEKESS